MGVSFGSTGQKLKCNVNIAAVFLSIILCVYNLQTQILRGNRAVGCWGFFRDTLSRNIQGARSMRVLRGDNYEVKLYYALSF